MAPRELAHSIVEVAIGAGLPTVALITDMNELLARAAGNAVEVRNAGRLPDRRARATRGSIEVTLALGAELLALGRAGRRRRPRRARRACSERSMSGAAAERFERMVARLGGPADLPTLASRVCRLRP